MNKEDVYKFLDSKNIWYEVTNHKAVFSMSEIEKVDSVYKEFEAKNLFLNDDKKQNYYLLTVMTDKKIDLKKFRKENNTRPLSFAKEEELIKILNLKPGSVTPFGLLNNTGNNVEWYIDKAFMKENIIGIHPNENTATVWLHVNDLISIIKEKDNKVYVIEV